MVSKGKSGHLLSWGRLLTNVPEIDALHIAASERLVAGEPEQDVRAWVIEQGREMGFIGPRVLLPSLTRRIMRMSLSEFLRKLATELAGRWEGKRVSDVADGLMAKVGFDDWFADYIIGWAKTGTPGAFFEVMGGRVWTQQMGFGEDKVPVVWAVITPTSDPKELLREAAEACFRAFPAGTFSRYAADEEAARIVTMRHQGTSFGEIAEVFLDENEPQLRTMGKAVFRERRGMEAKRVQRKYERFWGKYADSFFSQLFPDSD